MNPFGDFSVTVNAAILVAAAAVITLAGIRLAAVADRLADVTGLGEAITGAVLLGASTSLPGIVSTVTAAGAGYPQLAISNAVGGIAAQTFFLAVADIGYRRANLEHAAASLANLMNGCLLVALLSLVLLAQTAPPVSLFGIHPMTPIVLLVYGFGLRLVSRAQEQPMWGAKTTSETAEDTPDEPAGDKGVLRGLVVWFAALALIVGAAGYVVAQSGIALARDTGLSEGLVGTLFTAVATSMPELVTTVAAVRRGALTLAVGGIMGGNAFDVLFVTAGDIAYRPGSIYHAVAEQQTFILALCLVMTSVLLLGMLRRERHGMGNIGFESASVLVLYLGGVAVLAFWPA
ncbi:MAG: sodium:calcium antiporter [Inquilinaceae bacterium]